MTRSYGWTGRLRHGLWQCPKCHHHNYFRTATIRLDSICRAQGCSYRARCVLDRLDDEFGIRSRGRPRQVIIREYPPHRPPSTIQTEMRERNSFARRMKGRMRSAELKLDLSKFQKGSTILKAIDEADIERHGTTFRLIARPDLKLHPYTGVSRMQPTRKLGEPKQSKKEEE